MAVATPYQKNVFINCPFDRSYRPIFHAFVFAVRDAGYSARSAQEVRDTGEVRSERILRLLRESKFGLHDISRTTGRISVIKRRHGLRRCRYRGADGTARWVGLGVIANNLMSTGTFVNARATRQRTNMESMK